jgi:hypothetical protein
MLEHALDQLPREVRGLVGETGAEGATLPGLLCVGTVEIDLEERLQRDPTRRVTAGARRSLLHGRSIYAAVAALAPIASTRREETARSATAIAQRTMPARARPCVTTETPAMPRSGADTYWS